MKLSAVEKSQRAADLFTRTLKVEFSPEDVLSAKVLPSAFGQVRDDLLESQRLIESFDEDADDAADVEKRFVGLLASSLAALVDEWDLTDEDGEPLAPTVENLVQLPQRALTIIAFAIYTELVAEVQAGKGLTTSSSSSKRSKKQGKKPRKN